ncbi:MAG: hypothetical protein ONB48_19975 [candidate division KSB1 bacterium]|nr:hypothetical protein [candidate division KSB1 bacterium]MDZ7276269.1 hypothetical protein [candidate division KSB1 bacterium]MDZ7287925.1 hypothetical protein [candidate division KSB1 bacterium]MDZ7300062.1 hypothetical protein [candidate division KSB1 bacterium]MDZ7307304.1 hypothetical protein [candidate division KSB1 bacterium]
MSKTIVLNRDEAVRIIQEMLLLLGPQVKIEIQQSNNTVTLRAQTDQPELLQWAERIGDRYQNVFERLAKS